MNASPGINRIAFDSRAEHPIVVPVLLDRVGIVASFQLEVTVSASYECLLRFDLQRDDMDERARLHSLLRLHRQDRGGKPLLPAVSTPVMISVEQRDGSHWMECQSLDADPVLSGWSNRSFFRRLGELPLESQSYRMHMFSRRCAMEFENVPVQLVLRRQSFWPLGHEGRDRRPDVDDQ